MTKVMLSQTRGYQYDNGGRRSRTAARSAMNIMITDLRMTQDNGGVTYLDATNNRRVDVRVPIALRRRVQHGRHEPDHGDRPRSTPSSTQSMQFGGYAVRNATTGIYSYVPGGIDQRGRQEQLPRRRRRSTPTP